MTVLAGDIGATRCRLGLVRVEGERVCVEERAEYPSADYTGLGAVVSRYLDEVGCRPERAAFGVAAPIREGRADFANMDWVVDRERLARRIEIEDVGLVNDFEALAHALPVLGEEGLVELHEGEPEPGGAVAVLGAGTGLGHAFVTRRGGEERVHSSEAGHVDFGPRDPEQDALLRWLRGRYGRASYERVVSGPGLVDVHRFLLHTGRSERDPVTAERLEAEDPPAVISDRGLAGDDPACRRALELFVRAYGAQAGNFALAVQATGGVYLGGGIAPKILPVLRDGGFRVAFLDKGKMAGLMGAIPVHVITAPDAGLIGAARAARD